MRLYYVILLRFLLAVVIECAMCWALNFMFMILFYLPIVTAEMGTLVLPFSR